VFVADVDAHSVCALDASDGRLLWEYGTGARVDSPPTHHGGHVLFGSRDGWVYCVRAADGVLAWRFRALPDRRICAYEQPESVWPVCGSILVLRGVAYFVAGRNSFTDGGLFLFGLDPKTGEVIHQKHMSAPVNQDGFPVLPPGNKGDVLLADDRFVYLRHQAFNPDLTPVGGQRHLITSHGFTEAIPHHRSFWTVDTSLRYDISTGQGPVHGDILVNDGARYYEVRGYQPSRTATFDPRKGGYTLFAGEFGTLAAQPRAGGAAEGTGRRQPKKHASGSARERWSTKIPLTGKAMAMAADVLFVAGTPVAFPEEDLHRAYEGRMGGVLWAASTEDGKKLAEYTLDAPPVWDSLAAAQGHLYLCTTDGKVRCFATPK
jgi:outer membrane protein assembly factor BamB